MNHSKLILLLGCTGVLIGTGGLLIYAAHHHQPMQELYLKDDSERRSYLAQWGHTAAEEPPVQSEAILPEGGTSSVYETYCALQEAQHLPLSQYAGQEAVIWTYTLTCSASARAELICTPDGLLLGAMCYDCTRFDRMYALITE
ncbi:MAG: DUF4830 domain-containing protein [Ruminococcus sp.]